MIQLDPDLQFIFEKLTTTINFLGTNLKIINHKLHFDVYHEPKYFFSYLQYISSQHRHMKNNIAFPLANYVDYYW